MSVTYWLNQISTYESTSKKWIARAEKIEKRYRDEQSMAARPNQSAKFNILWSNVQTIIPAVFSRLPKPDVSRRFKDSDPVGRVASIILERALEYEIEKYPDYRGAMANSVQDRFLGGRGTSWIRYEPHFRAVQIEQPTDGLGATEDIDEPNEELDYECAPVDYVHWRDFLHGQGRTWEEVAWVGRRIYMRRPALVERFGEELGNEIPLDTQPEERKRKEGSGGDYEACIYEIWDKPSGKVFWLSKSMNQVLDERDDPLELEQFFPCPKPLFATLTTDTLVPVPDFTLYQDQAKTLDKLSDRIDGFVDALRVRGAYDAATPALSRIFSEGDNTVLVPVENWAAFAEKSGIAGTISLVDLKPIYEALRESYAAMEQQKQQVYEITGIADIVRGQGESGETATAQRIKGQYASLRLKSMQNQVAQYAAELIELKAQVICGHFEPQTIAQMACVEQFSEVDKQYVVPALELLKSGSLSGFRIEVSADSLVQIDEDREKEQATEFITAVSGFIANASKVPPEAAPMMGELLKFGVSRFKAGKTMEGVIDEFVEKTKEQAAQPKGPSPEQIKAQAEQAKMQFEQQKMQQEAAQQAAETQRAQMEMQMEAMRSQLEAQALQAEQQREDARLRLEAMQAQQEARDREMDRQLQILLQRMKDENSLEQAQISANTTLQAAQESAAEKASENE